MNSSRFATHFYAPSKMHTHQFITKSTEWNRPLTSTENPLGSLAPPLPPTFLPPPSPLRLMANKPDPGRSSGSINLSTQPGPPTPTFRSDFVNLRFDLIYFFYYFISTKYIADQFKIKIIYWNL